MDWTPDLDLVLEECDPRPSQRLAARQPDTTPTVQVAIISLGCGRELSFPREHSPVPYLFGYTHDDPSPQSEQTGS